MISKAGFKVALCLAALVLLGFPAAAHAQSIIKQPGNHPDYAVEIEPHLGFQWAGRYYNDSGFGPGVRFNIPIVRNGFVPRINNNVAITFGTDLTFGGGDRSCYPFYDPARQDYRCSVTELWFPVAMQWNFWLTKVVSVFGEPGLAIVHRWWSYDYYCNNAGPICTNRSGNTTDLEPVFSAGGRFMFSNTVGATVRIGYPMVSAGINILL